MGAVVQDVQETYSIIMEAVYLFVPREHLRISHQIHALPAIQAALHVPLHHPTVLPVQPHQSFLVVPAYHFAHRTTSISAGHVKLAPIAKPAQLSVLALNA